MKKKDLKKPEVVIEIYHMLVNKFSAEELDASIRVMVEFFSYRASEKTEKAIEDVLYKAQNTARLFDNDTDWKVCLASLLVKLMRVS